VAKGLAITFNEFFLSREEADVLVAALANLSWTRGTFMGKPVPRDEVWMGPYRYKFSGRTLNPIPWTPEIHALRNKIQVQYGGEYNSVLINRYADGNDSVSWHADDEPEMDSKHPIASVSVGASREFLTRRNDTRNVERLLLSSGSLLIMPAGLQQKYKHSVPKTKTPVGVRINLTFRRML
jgi:alkylated DNA repair dioxygenase AlkB